MSRHLNVVLLPGDGIGPEVLAEGRKVLDQVARHLDIDLVADEIPCGGRYYLEHGVDWPSGSLERCRAADVIFLGAVGWPDPSGRGPVLMADGNMAGHGPVMRNRRELELYANIRPVKLFPGVLHRIHGQHRLVWSPSKVDMVFVRENTEGLYVAIGGRVAHGGHDHVASDIRIVTRANSERACRKAFEMARARHGAPEDGVSRVTCIVKDNVLEGCRFFRDVFFEVARDFPEIQAETAIVDAFTQWLVQRPEHYDVLVTTNMFGDIVTDLASVLQGGMGMAVGCNVGDRHAMFEPIHGSAPRHAGKGRANPIAMALAIREGLAWHGRRTGDAELVAASDRIEQAVAGLLEKGAPLTYDLVGEERAATTSQVGDALAAQVGELLAG